MTAFYRSLLVLFLVVAGHTPGHAQMYRLWEKLPSQVVLDQGRAYAARNIKSDSAMVCFTIVSNRYYDGMKRDDKRICATAMNNLACCYTYGYVKDFPQALSYLTKALAIAEANGFEREKGIIYINMANLYSMCGSNFDAKGMVKHAVDYYIKSFQQGVKTESYDLQTNAFIDLFSSPNVRNVSLQPFASLFSKSMPDSTADLRYARMLYKAVAAEMKGNYAVARRIYIELLPVINMRWTPEIYVMDTHMSIARTYAMERNYARAIASYKQAQAMANADSNLVVLAAVAGSLSQVCRSMGDTVGAEKYKIQQRDLRDSLIATYGLNVTGGMFLEMAEQRTQQLAAEQRVRSAVINMLLLLLVAVGAFLVMLVKKNRQLSLRNRKLYDNNVEMLQTEEQLRVQREQESLAMHGEKKEKSHPDALDSDSRQHLYARIQTVMENPEWFCRNDFSLPLLAQLVGSNKTYVSQTINTCHGQNFVTWLGNCRVKEACRRINNHDKYGQFTLEGISESVGFKSRTTFTTAFKRLIGLTPSEYLKISKKKEKS